MSSMDQITKSGSVQSASSTPETSTSMSQRQNHHQYIRPLAREPGVRSRLGFWVGDVRIGSADDLKHHVQHADADGLLFNGIVTQTTSIELLEAKLRMKDRELEEMRSSHANQEFSLRNTTTTSQGMKRKLLQAYIDLQDVNQLEESASPAESECFQKTSPSRPAHEPQYIPQTPRLSDQLDSSSGPATNTTLEIEESATPPSLERALETKPEEPFRFKIPESEHLNTTPYTIVKPAGQPQTPSRSENRSEGLPTCDFSFSVPFRPVPPAAVTPAEEEVDQLARCDSPQQAEDADDQDRSAQDEAHQSGAPASYPSVFPDPDVFSGDPGAFPAFDAQMLLKMAMDGDKFEDDEAKYDYVLSRLGGEAQNLVVHTTLDRMAQGLNTEDIDMQTWFFIMTLLSMKYGPLLPAQSATPDDDTASETSNCKSRASGVDEAKASGEIPQPEVLTGEPHVVTEEEALAAAERVAAREAAERHGAE
ncbi:uncharacterized protein J3D65DRAFT_674255 [Phyllosticta citribraziliensis]|uniref:Uncharacterized protein n=1 Tax=Phyllosticta citribraziliensis TaxID=989973 RepID=A0ABR1M5I2_9PEZI